MAPATCVHVMLLLSELQGMAGSNLQPLSGLCSQKVPLRSSLIKSSWCDSNTVRGQGKERWNVCVGGGVRTTPPQSVLGKTHSTLWLEPSLE